MQDPVSPFANVLHAEGPGYLPFKMCHPYCSHTSMSQGARLLVCGSSLLRGMVISLMVGDRSATRAFQSPHTTYAAYYGILLMMSSIWLRAISSSMPLLCKLRAGGKYIFPIHTFSLP